MNLELYVLYVYLYIVDEYIYFGILSFVYPILYIIYGSWCVYKWTLFFP